MTPPTPLDETRIRRTIAQFCHLTDDGDFDAWVRLFAEDGCFRLGGKEYRGREVLRRFIEADQPPGARGLHLTTDTVITPRRDHVEARSNFVFIAAGDTASVIVAAGRYLDVLVRAGDEWLFQEREAILMLPVATRKWGAGAR